MLGLGDALGLDPLDLGFDLVGVATAGPVDDADRLADWLEHGRQGGMAYLRRTASLRRDPRGVLPDCRSVVVVALSYHTDLPPSTDPLPGDRVWISRYAWGRDYHKLLKKRLLHLGRRLEQRTGDGRWRVFVDTGPVLERWWAERAGLGWVGSNTCLINRRLGSELFLGVLLTTVPLTPSEPATAHCGRCTACLEACPTGALIEPGLLDARRCLSYLTIEHHGPIDPRRHHQLGRNVAGCDVCQEVCPWNRRAPTNLHPEFLPAAHRFRPRLDELEALDEARWREWRRGSPLNRIRFADLLRTLAVVRANVDRSSSRTDGRPQTREPRAR